MWKYWRTGILLAGCLFLAEASSFSQSVTVRSITISGLHRTKPSVIYRELTFAEGDSLLQIDLGEIMERNENNLFNLGIFNEVIVNVSEWDTKLNLIDVSVEVTESWYIYLVPILDLADRNFNVWWTTYNHALDRVNLGARLEWLNFSGRNDKVKALLQFGYTPKQELEYRFPYLNKRQSFGITTGFLHSINKEVGYSTVENQEQFVKLDDHKLQERWQGSVRAVYRPNFFMKYDLSMVYQNIKVDPRVIDDYNPYYFRNGDSTHSGITLRLAIEYDNRDLKIFPATGIKALLETEKIGLGAHADENSLVSILSLEWNTTTGRRFQHRVSAITQYSFSRSRPSFMYYDALGESQKYVSGYELYVMDGMDFFVSKYQLAYKLLEKQSELGNVMPVKQFRQVQIALYVSLLAETGYVNDPFTGDENPYSNRWLYGGGPAMTLLMYNNFLFQFSYCTNHLGEWGLYIHNRTAF